MATAARPIPGPTGRDLHPRANHAACAAACPSAPGCSASPPGALPRRDRSAYLKATTSARATQARQVAAGAAMSASLPGIPLLPKVQEVQEPPKLPAKLPPHISFAGGGIYFFWYLGVVKFLKEHIDLAATPMTGASAGALVVVQAACGVCPDLSVRVVNELSHDYKIFTRPGGVLGVWRDLLYDWLDRILPADAHMQCRDRVHIITTVLFDKADDSNDTVPMKQVVHTDFSSRDDLINAALTSCHVPFLMNLKFASRYRGGMHIDGSTQDFLENKVGPHLHRGGTALLFDFTTDVSLGDVDPEIDPEDFLRVYELEQVHKIIQAGYTYTQKLRDAGGLAHFDWIEAALSTGPEDAAAVLEAAQLEAAKIELGTE